MTIQDFAALVEKETREKYEKFFTTPNREDKECLVNHASEVKVIPGKKYTKVDVGHSGKYMIVNDTGEIFGVKAYGVIHKGHRYGTLDTINDWHWGEYTGIRKAA
jgi:hypothetical protein